ncbi:MAG TPA: MerR family transcriptional regulator [Myxococcota bacterium]|nr:MerR family transcriptional regulator [Myxococcota bacterium]
MVTKLYYRIGEVARLARLKPYVLRFWETEFSAWLKPEKSRAGQRAYTRKDVELVLRLKALLHEQRFTIAGARRLLQGEARGRPAAGAAGAAAEDAAGAAAESAVAAAAHGIAAHAREAARRALAEVRRGLRELRAAVEDEEKEA